MKLKILWKNEFYLFIIGNSDTIHVLRCLNLGFVFCKFMPPISLYHFFSSCCKLNWYTSAYQMILKCPFKYSITDVAACVGKHHLAHKILCWLVLNFLSIIKVDRSSKILSISRYNAFVNCCSCNTSLNINFFVICVEVYLST